jgi:hypothetical protein
MIYNIFTINNKFIGGIYMKTLENNKTNEQVENVEVDEIFSPVDGDWYFIDLADDERFNRLVEKNELKQQEINDFVEPF